MTPLSLKFTPQMADYSKSGREFLRKASEKLAWIGIAFYIPMSIFYALLVFKDSSSPLFWLIVFFTLGLPFFFIGRIFSLPINVDQNLIKPTEWILSDNGLLIRNPIMNANLEWDNFSKALESPEYYFLVSRKNKNMFYMLPKRAFENSDNEQDFRETIKAKCGDIYSVSVSLGPKFALALLGALYLFNIILLIYSNFQAAL